MKTIYICFCVLALIFCISKIIRSRKVYKLSNLVIKRAHDYAIENQDLSILDDVKKLIDRHSEMMFSFKELTPENWLSKKVYDKLFGENDT